MLYITGVIIKPAKKNVFRVIMETNVQHIVLRKMKDITHAITKPEKKNVFEIITVTIVPHTVMQPDWILHTLATTWPERKSAWKITITKIVQCFVTTMTGCNVAYIIDAIQMVQKDASKITMDPTALYIIHHVSFWSAFYHYYSSLLPYLISQFCLYRVVFHPAI